MRPLNPALFPQPVLSAQMAIDLAAPPSEFEERLHPSEAAFVARAVARRQREFATGRRLAHALLAELGLPPTPIPNDEKRAPVWPAGAVGSISHSRGWCAVAVARAEEVASLGVDVETRAGLETKLWEHVLTERERRTLRALPVEEAEAVALRVFSAKEALYKAQFPLTRAWLGFEGVEIELGSLEAQLGSFRVRWIDRAAARALERFELTGRLEVAERITAAVTLLAPR